MLARSIAVPAALAVAAGGAITAWMLLRPVPHAAVKAAPEVIPIPAAVPAPAAADAAVEILPPLPKGAQPRTPQAVFEAKFKVAREAPRPAPNPAILAAPTFAEAFRIMKESEGQAPADAAAANPFGASR